jgi:hypothetical protein
VFGVGAATRIYLAPGATDMRNYALFIDMRSDPGGRLWNQPLSIFWTAHNDIHFSGRSMASSLSGGWK